VKRVKQISLLFVICFISCIGTKPLGFRKVKFSKSESYYTKGKPKEITRTKRIYQKDCPGCRETIKTSKTQYSQEGSVIYKEKVKREMYKAKLVKVKSKSYYENGKIKEERKIIRGNGFVKKYDEQGKLISETRFKDGKSENPADSISIKINY